MGFIGKKLGSLKKKIQDTDLGDVAAAVGQATNTATNLANKTVELAGKTKEAVHTVSGMSGEEIKAEAARVAKKQAEKAKEAATNKAGEIKDRTLEKAEDAAQTLKASQAATKGVATKKKDPESTVVIIPAEADKEGNITKFGAGVEVSKKALAKGKEGHAAIKELAAELKTDLAENGAESTLEDATAAAKEKYGDNTQISHAIIATKQKLALPQR